MGGVLDPDYGMMSKVKLPATSWEKALFANGGGSGGGGKLRQSYAAPAADWY